MPVNSRCKDTFFKTVYATETRQKELASFLLGVDVSAVNLANVQPILFGNRENDLAFICDAVVYAMTECQSKVSPNITYRLLEYITAGLRATVDSADLLYGSGRVYFPVPKLYVLQVGLEPHEGRLPGQVAYDMRLSDSYKDLVGAYKGKGITADLEVITHVYDFRMTLSEMLTYIEKGITPQRFSGYNNDMCNYALTANGITYIQRAAREKDKRSREYVMPANVLDVAAYLNLLIKRNIFADLLSDKEVCDMALAQFSRDDMLIYQGREEGREEGEMLHLIKVIYKKTLKGRTNEQIADETEEDSAIVEQVKQAIMECKKECGTEDFSAEQVLKYYRRS
ncbi:MAG: hypothetical protein K2P63_10485 [Lachnospiraceae bacterium]|nr:hypothetical protein [Lachnospiraceae bacterium]